MSCLFKAPRKNPSTCPWTNPAIATRSGGFSWASLAFAAQVIPIASAAAARIMVHFIAVSCSQFAFLAHHTIPILPVAARDLPYGMRAS
jgi:hypothetical protein